MASMQGNNILGEKKKEAKARSASGFSGFDQYGTGPAGVLAADRRRRSGPRRVENRPRNVGEKRGRKRTDGLSLPAVEDKRASAVRMRTKIVQSSTTINHPREQTLR